MSWKNTADMPMVPIARAIAAAIGTPSMPQRVDSDASATATTVGGARLLELADDQRAEVGQRSTAASRSSTSGRPAASRAGRRSRSPDPCEQAAVLADRELAHPPQDEQLDLGDLRQVDERFDVGSRSASIGVLRRRSTAHGTATRSMTSSITMSAVRPWLAACGPSQMRWPRT